MIKALLAISIAILMPANSDLSPRVAPMGVRAAASCPGWALTYDCDITSGGYLEFRIGMSSREVFDILCRGSSAPHFRYADIDALNVPDEVRARHRGIVEAPSMTYSVGANSPEEFCSLSDLSPYVVDYYIRRDRLWPFGDLVSLEIRNGRLHSIHLATGTLDF